MKRQDVEFTSRVYTMIVKDFLEGDSIPIRGAMDYAMTDKGYKLDRLVMFFAKTYPLVKRRIDKQIKAKAGRVITLTQEMVVH
jgi:hypothetical protein